MNSGERELKEGKQIHSKQVKSTRFKEFKLLIPIVNF